MNTKIMITSRTHLAPFSNLNKCQKASLPYFQIKNCTVWSTFKAQELVVLIKYIKQLCKSQMDISALPAKNMLISIC